jgi:OOP family OmpA-OmpF porin
MSHKNVTAIGLVGLLTLTGCSAMRERRWSYCALGGGLLGAVAGAGTAGGLVNAYEGGEGGSDAETGAAAGAGAVGGAVVGALVGHLLCDPRKEALPPPPPPPSPPPAPKHMELSADTYFDFDKATLKPEGERKVEEIVRALKDNPKQRVVIEGHTDSIGSDAYNQRLSERRADSVGRYMVSRGIDPQRITTRGHGESKPIASNKTAEGRAQNRRVDIDTK